MEPTVTIGLAAAGGTAAVGFTKSVLDFIFKKKALDVSATAKEVAARTELIKTLMEKVEQLEKYRLDEQDRRFAEREIDHKLKLDKNAELADLHNLMTKNDFRIKELEEHSLAYVAKNAELELKVNQLEESVRTLTSENAAYKIQLAKYESVH